MSHDYDNGLADMLDVVGQNYRENEILAAHDQKPSRAIIGTENTHDRAAWLALRDHAPYSGQFLWSGLDYLGEAGKWPLISRTSGLFDRAALPHPLPGQQNPSQLGQIQLATFPNPGGLEAWARTFFRPRSAPAIR